MNVKINDKQKSDDRTSKEQTSDDRLLTKINSWQTSLTVAFDEIFADENFLLYSTYKLSFTVPRKHIVPLTGFALSGRGPLFQLSPRCIKLCFERQEMWGVCDNACCWHLWKVPGIFLTAFLMGKSESEWTFTTRTVCLGISCWEKSKIPSFAFRASRSTIKGKHMNNYKEACGLDVPGLHLQCNLLSFKTDVLWGNRLEIT